MANIETKLQFIANNPEAADVIQVRRQLRQMVATIIVQDGGANRYRNPKKGKKQTKKEKKVEKVQNKLWKNQETREKTRQQQVREKRFGLPTSEGLAPPRLTYDRASIGIRFSISEGAIKLGMCGGIITSSFLDKMAIQKDDFIVMAYSKGLGAVPYNTRYGQNVWRFSGFATCNFKYDWLGRKTLYINVLCANVPGVAQKIMTEVICNIGRSLGVAGHISAIQLSSLTYVIGYYYKKWGFRFYNDDGIYSAVNTKAKDIPRLAGDEAEYSAEWREKLDEGAKSEWAEAVDAAATTPEGKILLGELVKAMEEPGRRATLTKRLGLVKQILDLAPMYAEKLKVIAQFMLDASEFSVSQPNFNVPSMRNPLVEAEILKNIDPAAEGWRMYLPVNRVLTGLPAPAPPYAPSILNPIDNIPACIGGGGGRKKRGKSKRRKKGTRKKALKKRHRRRRKRTKRPKRRRRTRRRRRRRRRRTRR